MSQLRYCWRLWVLEQFGGVFPSLFRSCCFQAFLHPSPPSPPSFFLTYIWPEFTEARIEGSWLGCSRTLIAIFLHGLKFRQLLIIIKSFFKWINQPQIKVHSNCSCWLILPLAPNVEQEERPGRRTRRNSDSFLCVKPNENEIGLMKLMEETEDKWREEKKMLELRIAELEETLKAERTRDLDRKHLGT